MRKLPLFSALKCVAFLAAFYLIYQGTKTITDGFTVTAIDQNISLSEVSASMPEEVSQRLSQPFYYFGAGGQSYVFLGQDQKTILKFFKKNHGFSDRMVLGLQSLLPSSLIPYRKKFLPTRNERFDSIFTGCKIAYERLREETKILYLHLEPENLPIPSITITDPLGISHKISLETTPFLIQERAEPFFSHFKQLVRTGKIEEAQASIHSLLVYLVRQCRQGIRDTDNGLKRNYGFFGEDAALIDTGSLLYDPTLTDPALLKKEVTRKSRRLERWLREHHSELLLFFEKELATCDTIDAPCQTR